MNDDMKIILQASLDQSESAIKALKKDIGILKSKLQDERLGITAKLDTGNESTRAIKADIDALKEKLSSKKLPINYKINLSSENKAKLNEDIDKLSNNKSVHALKLRVQLNIDANTIASINKQIDSLTGKLSNIRLNTNIDTSSVSQSQSMASPIQANSGANVGNEESANERVATSRQKINNLLKQSEKYSQNQVRLITDIQNSVTEIQREMLLVDANGNKIGQTTELIHNYAQVTNSLYKQQKQLQKEIYDWEKLRANADDSQLAEINQVIESKRKIIEENEAILRGEGLQNEQLQKQLDSYTRMVSLKQQQQESLRTAKLGTEVSGGSAVAYGDTKSIEDWAKSIHGAGVNVTNMKTKVKSLADEQTQFTVSTKSSKGMVTEYTYALDKATGKVFKMGERTREAGRRTLDFLNDIKIAIARTFQWNIAMGTIYGTLNKFKEGVSFIKELDYDLTQVAVVTNQTRQQVAGLAQEYLELAKATSKTVKEISSVNTELVRQGLSTKESGERLDTILKLSAVASMDVNSTLSIITSSVNALGESAEKTADVLVRAGNISASSVDTIGIAMQKVASSAKNTGMSIEELSSIVSVLIDVTQEAPETLGNSLKSIMARFNKINEETGELNQELNDVQKAFSSVNIDFTDAEGQIRPVYELLGEMGDKWKDLTNNQKNYIATQSAGTMQGNRFIAMMENWNKVSEMTSDLEQNSSGIMDESYTVWLDSVEAKANNLKIAWEELWLTVINSESVKAVLEALTLVINGVSVVFKNLGVSGIATGLTMVSVAHKMELFSKVTKVLGKDFAGMASIFKSSKQIMTGVGTSMRGLFTLISQNGVGAFRLLGSAMTRSTAGTKLHTEAMALCDIVAGKLNLTIANRATIGLRAYSTQVLIATAQTLAFNAVATLLTATLTFGASIIISGIVTALSSWLFKSKEVNTEIQRQNEELAESMKSYKQNAKALKDMNKEFSELQARVESSSESMALTSDEQERYNELVGKLVEISPDVVDYYDEAGNAVLKYGTNIQDLIDKQEALANLEKDKIVANSDDTLKNVETKIKELNEKKKTYEILMEGGTTGKQAKNLAKWGESYEIDYVKSSHKKYVDSLYDIISSEETSLEEKKKAKEAILDIDRAYVKASASMRVVNAELDEQKEALRQVVDISMEDSFDTMGMSEGMKSIGTDFVITAFSDAFDEDVKTATDKGLDAIGDFESIFSQLEDILNDSTPRSIVDNEEALNGLITSLEDMGYPTELVTNLIYALTNAMTGASDASGTLALSLGLITSTAKEQYNEINKLQGYYLKLAKGEKLSIENMEEMLELYPELIDYINEEGDLTLKNGEIVKELYESKYNELINGINLQKKEKEITKDRLLTEKKYLQENLEVVKRTYGEKSPMYEDSLNKIKENDIALSDVNDSIGKLSKEANVYKQVFSDAFATDNIDNLADAYDNATNKISFYQEVLSELDKNKGLSPETVQKIITSHQELMYVLGDEGQMYELLSQLIQQEGDVQKDTYRQMMFNSSDFYNSMTSGHKELFTRIAQIYNVNLENFKNMNQLMAEIAGQGANTILGKYQGIAGISQKTALEKSIAEIEGTIKVSKSYAEVSELVKELQNYQTQLSILNASDESLDKATSNIPFTPIKTSSSSSKKSEKSKIDFIELQTDAYLRLKKAMEDVERQQKNNEKMYKYATGEDRVKLLSKEIQLLNKQQSVQSALATQYREEMNNLKSELSKKIGMNDGTNGINNYNAYMEAQEKAINNIIKQINANVNNENTYEALKTQKESMEENAKDFKEKFEKYIELALNTVPDLSDNWWEAVYEKFELTLEIMETDLKKFEDKVNRVNKSINYILQGKNDNTKNLQAEYDLITQIAKIYQEQIENVKEKVDANSKMVKTYEKQLSSIADKQSNTYLQTSRYLILARAEQDKLAESLETALDNYSNQLNTQISKHVEMLEKMKETAIETFTAMRNELEQFSVKEFEVSLDTILAELDKLDNIFMSNPEFKLETSDARGEISNLEKDIKGMYSKISSYKNETKKITDREIKSEKDAIKQKEDLLAFIQEQIEYENELKDIYTSISEELQDTTLEYKKIEDALQAIIDAKQDELDSVKEQFEEEKAITAMMEKRLALLRAMDDTRFSYITGTGEETFTYDVSNVNSLKQDLGKAQREDEQNELLESLEEEIDKLQEDLERTQQIHEQELAVLQLAQDNISSMLGLLEDNLDTNLGDNLDKIYENLTDMYIDNLQIELETQTTLLKNLYTLMDNRLAVNATKITESVNTKGASSLGKSQSVQVGKNQSTLADMAKAHNTDVSTLLALNSSLKENTVLKYGQNIKVPSFDTGGFTGAFGQEGKLAILHEKELVLNKDDTTNVLEAIDIAKAIAGGLTRGLGESSTFEKVTNTNTSEQQQIIENMNIYGVKDANSFANEMQKVFRSGMARLS